MNPVSSSSSSRERGSALILFLGVAAALSIVAAGLLVLLLNTQHSTARERTRTKAFHVAEAALDVAMEELGHKMPTSVDTGWFDAAAFSQRFLPAPGEPMEFAGADAADPLDFVQVRLADNTDGKPYDSNGDGLVFVDAQARVGTQSARVHALVQAIYASADVIRPLALWSGGPVTSGGQNPKVTVEVFPPGSTDCAWAAPASTDTLIGASYMDFVASDAAEGMSLESVISVEKIDDLTALAQKTGRYFTSPTGPAGTGDGYNGLCVIYAPGQEVRLTGETDYNTEDQPGMLLVLGTPENPPTLHFGGNTEYFGIVYCAGTVTSNGTDVVHGMLITVKGFGAGGTPDIRYNDRCIRGLNSQFPVGTRLVPGYWRELKPTM